MFTHDLDPTDSYRMIARGFGCGWARTYRMSQHGPAAQQRRLRRTGEKIAAPVSRRTRTPR
jgi:hypothetical protein